MDDSLEIRQSASSAAPPTDSRVPMAVLVLALILANAVLLAQAHSDQSWGALGIAFLVGPLTNAIISFVSATTAMVRTPSGESVLTGALLLSFVLPIGAVLFDIMYIFTLDLHGC